MAAALPRFCPILDRSLRPELSLEEVARALDRAGVRWVQLRAKQATSRALLQDAQRLVSLLPANFSVIVNDRADVALLAGAAGVHLGQDDLPVEAARRLLGPERIAGLSTHDLEQLEAGQSSPADYLAIGPVFATHTKPDTEPVVGLEGLRAARARSRKPLVAIGGITVENAGEVMEAGADAVAVISGWLAAEDLAGRLEEFRRALGRLD
jgi:thiamine-phosphate pyrophosphorylase